MQVIQFIKERKVLSLHRINHLLKAIILLVLIVASCFFYLEYGANSDENNENIAIISTPKINDIYFLDFRLLSDELRPNQKYRIAKVVDITGDIITLLYSDYFYQHKNAAINSIKYGQLSFTDYFSPKRYDIPLEKLNKLYNKGAIYLAKRPIRNKLYGNLVGPQREKLRTNPLLLGLKENVQGEAFLQDKYNETRFKSAFELFEDSANLGYAKGQINFAQMYINGQYVNKDLNKALYWLKKASLQSNKLAILKYGIVCKQVERCNISDFYKELTGSGVNIKVRQVDFELSK